MALVNSIIIQIDKLRVAAFRRVMNDELFHKAVAYLVESKKSIPTDIKDFVEELHVYYKIEDGLRQVDRELRNSMRELQEKLVKNSGAAEAIIGMIRKKITDEQIKEFSVKFTPPNDEG